jgi:hypothetical protein
LVRVERVADALREVRVAGLVQKHREFGDSVIPYLGPSDPHASRISVAKTAKPSPVRSCDPRFEVTQADLARPPFGEQRGHRGHVREGRAASAMYRSR